MNPSSMRNPQWSVEATWSLDGRRSITVSATCAAKRLRVRKGRAWVTVPGGRGQSAEDHWLDAGDCITVPAGRCLWVDGWPEADLEVCVPSAQPGQAARLWQTVRRTVFRLIGRWPSAPRPCGQSVKCS